MLLNGDSIDFTGASSLSLNNLFFATAPISLGSGMSSGDIALSNAPEPGYYGVLALALDGLLFAVRRHRRNGVA